MPKKKQAKYSVSMPYELRDNKLWMQPITWPPQCPCCNERYHGEFSKYKYSHRARHFQYKQGTETRSSYYPLDWEVPYCSQCFEHVNIAEKWKYGIAGFIIFGMLILLFWLGSSISDPALVLLLAGSIVGGIALYKAIVELVIKPKMKSDCLDYNFALRASSPVDEENNVTFHFDRHEYAHIFAVLNSAELEINS